MEDDAVILGDEAPAPAYGVRLAWWWGIYFAAQVPLMLRLGFETRSGYFILLLPFFFSEYLGTVFAFFQFMVPDSVMAVALPVCEVLSYIFYLGHFYLTYRAETRRGFFILMAVLVIVVLLNQVLFSGM